MDGGRRGAERVEPGPGTLFDPRRSFGRRRDGGIALWANFAGEYWWGADWEESREVARRDHVNRVRGSQPRQGVRRITWWFRGDLQVLWALGSPEYSSQVLRRWVHKYQRRLQRAVWFTVILTKYFGRIQLVQWPASTDWSWAATYSSLEFTVEWARFAQRIWLRKQFQVLQSGVIIRKRAIRQAVLRGRAPPESLRLSAADYREAHRSELIHPFIFGGVD